MVTEEAVRAALDELGPNSKAVADRFRRDGITGRTCLGDQCPVARFLCGRFPGIRFHVSHHHVSYPNGAGGGTAIGAPWGVHLFVGHFDYGLFPDLIDRTPTPPPDHLF